MLLLFKSINGNAQNKTRKDKTHSATEGSYY